MLGTVSLLDFSSNALLSSILKLFIVFETGSYVSQTDFKLAKYTSIPLNS